MPLGALSPLKALSIRVETMCFRPTPSATGDEARPPRELQSSPPVKLAR